MSRKTDPSTLRRVAANFARFRAESGLTQQQAADAADMSLSAIFKIEQALNMPSSVTLAKFAKIFRRDVWEFQAENPAARPIPAPRPEPSVWAAKVKPGVEVDDDLQRRVEEFLADISDEQLERIRKRKEEDLRKSVKPAKKAHK
jgi:transcriptional regulator with XRE-family HTH domain